MAMIRIRASVPDQAAPCRQASAARLEGQHIPVVIEEIDEPVVIEVRVAPARAPASLKAPHERVIIEEVDHPVIVEVGPEIARLLVQFSGAANQSSGSSHPADFKRWATFLVTVHRSGKRLDNDLLYATLREQGWPKEKASDLVSEFEFARELLSIADDVH